MVPLLVKFKDKGGNTHIEVFRGMEEDGIHFWINGTYVSKEVFKSIANQLSSLAEVRVGDWRKECKL